MYNVTILIRGVGIFRVGAGQGTISKLGKCTIMIIRIHLYGIKSHSYGVTVKTGAVQHPEHPAS